MSAVVHVTAIRGRDVYGHDCSDTDAADDCGGFVARYYPEIDASAVERGRVYEVSEDGEVLAVVSP